MARIPVLALLIALTIGVGLAPASAQDAPADAEAPAVVVEEPAPPPDDEAWTFRYLIPTVLALSGLALLLTAILYAVRVKGRYRVAR